MTFLNLRLCESLLLLKLHLILIILQPF